MGREMKKKLLLFLLLNACLFGQSQNAGWENDAAPLHRAEKALTDVIVHDVFSPPVASRIYAYANISAYEVLAGNSSDYVSLKDQLQSFPTVPRPARPVSTSLAAVYCFLVIGRQLVFS